MLLLSSLPMILGMKLSFPSCDQHINIMERIIRDRCFYFVDEVMLEKSYFCCLSGDNSRILFR